MKEKRNPTLEKPIVSRWEFIPGVLVWREGHRVTAVFLMLAIGFGMFGMVYAAFTGRGDYWVNAIFMVAWLIIAQGLGLAQRVGRLRKEERKEAQDNASHL